MKLNIAYPATGAQKTIEIEDEKKLASFFDKRMSQEVDLGVLGSEWAGYVAKITGGHDKQGFPMRQGVLAASRVRLLLPVGEGFRNGRHGERIRRAVRGCIVSHDLAVLHLALIKKGAAEVPGLTDRVVPRRLGPKRANNIRKLFLLDSEADVRKYVVRREIKKGDKRPKIKAAKIQRLITKERLHHKRRLLAEKKRRYEAAGVAAKQYAELLSARRSAAAAK
jgi:small subunit ribosomal protein S6e